MEKVLLKQMKEAYNKLFRLTSNGERDVSWWWLGRFKELCSEDLRNNEQLSNAYRTVDRLFTSEEACLTYKKFEKFESSPIDETSTFILILLDVIITDEVDNLLLAFENSENVPRDNTR